MKINLEIIDDKVKSLITSDDGSVLKKTISLEDLCRGMSKFNVSCGYVLPPGCRAFFQNGNLNYYLTVMPPFVGEFITKHNRSDSDELSGIGTIPTIKDLELHGIAIKEHSRVSLRILKIPYPATAALCVTQTKNDVDPANTLSSDVSMYFSRLYIWALKDINAPIETLQANYWPFANVYSDFHCCLGDVPSKIDFIEQISAYHRMMFTGIANMDLLTSVKLAKIEDGSLGKRVNAIDLPYLLHDRSVFPVEYLSSCGNLMNIVNSIITNRRD